MRFEKLNEDKIRITLNHDDLIKKDIDFHSFMTNAIESQDLFADCLKEAEKQIGFITKNYTLRIEALAMSSGDFILTVTRSIPEILTNKPNKKLHIKKNVSNTNNTQAVYLFSDFEDYCSFISFFKNNNFNINGIADCVLLYEYNNLFYLALKNINFSYPKLKYLLYYISEFGTIVNNSDLFIRKLSENGNLIIKNNAIKTSFKYF